MTDEQYRAQLVQHANDVDFVLSQVSEATRAFMRKRFQLQHLPLTYVREMAADIEQFKRNVEQQAAPSFTVPSLTVHVDTAGLVDEVLDRLTRRLRQGRNDIRGFVGGGEIGDY